jgi:hypothetical protein
MKKRVRQKKGKRKNREGMERNEKRKLRIFQPCHFFSLLGLRHEPCIKDKKGKGYYKY